jgi:hypothetical protein
MVLAGQVAGLEFREDPYRAGIVNVGAPILLSHEQLSAEMEKNFELDEFVNEYGRPDYAEIQRVEMDRPFLPYEVRLYYLAGDRYLVFGRYNLSPSFTNLGVRKFIGRLDAAMIERLLTAVPAKTAAYRPAPQAADQAQVAEIVKALEAEEVVEVESVVISEHGEAVEEIEEVVEEEIVIEAPN